MIIEFDVDGTIVTQGEPGRYEECQPLPNAIDTVNSLYDAGHIIIFNTARRWNFFELTYNSLKSMGFKFHSLVMGRVCADIIINDKAISSIDQIYEKLNNI